MTNLERETVVDLHCFALPVTRKLTNAELTRFFSHGGPTVKGVAQNTTMAEDSFSLRYFLKNLSDFLGCEPSVDALLEARNRSAKDFWFYVKQLFEDAGIRSLVIDDGLYREALDDMESNAPCTLYRVVRLEPLIDQALQTTRTFDEFLEHYLQLMKHAVTTGAKGFKSVIAYRTGLDVSPTTSEDAETEFLKIREGHEERRWFGPYAKKLRNYLFLKAAEFAAHHRVMLQIHTGLGDTDILGDKCNPLLLEAALKEGPLGEADVVLIHGGYPYTSEAAWLAQAFARVFIEISTPLPSRFLPPLSHTTLRTTLQFAPISKITYGSDGHGIPEFIWLSAKTAKRELEVTLEEFITQRVVTEREARKWGRAILSKNASQLLHI